MICKECGGSIYSSPDKYWHSDDWDTVVILSKQANVKPIHEAVPMFTADQYLCCDGLDGLHHEDCPVDA